MGWQARKAVTLASRAASGSSWSDVSIFTGDPLPTPKKIATQTPRRTPLRPPAPVRAVTPSVANAAGGDKLSGVVYGKILALIATHEFAVNSKLPTEHQLAETFKVSRPVVREALARLRDDGVVASRRGSGTYVLKAPSTAALQLAPISSIADIQRCFEFRISLEGETAFHAARPECQERRGPMAAALQALDRAVRSNTLGVEEDHAFHAAIAQATGNRFFESAMSAMQESIVTGMTVTRSLSLMRPRERLLAVHHEHLEIHNAIVSNDPERARAAMRRHLENARRRVFDGTDVV